MKKYLYFWNSSHFNYLRVAIPNNWNRFPSYIKPLSLSKWSLFENFLHDKNSDFFYPFEDLQELIRKVKLRKLK